MTRSVRPTLTTHSSTPAVYVGCGTLLPHMAPRTGPQVGGDLFTRILTHYTAGLVHTRLVFDFTLHLLDGLFPLPSDIVGHWRRPPRFTRHYPGGEGPYRTALLQCTASGPELAE